MGTALGGPYLGVHLRRKDFIWGHREDVPSLEGAVVKIRSLLEMHKLEKVFVATDAVEEGKQIVVHLALRTSGHECCSCHFAFKSEWKFLCLHP